MSIDRGLRPLQIPGYEFTPPNLLINPGFEIWQRGTGPFTGTTQSATADEWWMEYGGGATMSIQQETSEVLFGKESLRWDYNVSSGTNLLKQSFEAWKSLEDLWITASIWVKAPSYVYFNIRDNTGASGTDEYGSNSGRYPGDNVWRQLTAWKHIRTGLVSPPNPANWYPHDYPIMIQLTVGGDLAASGSIYVDGAIAAVGKYPEGVPFRPLHPSVDLNRCKRYYQEYEDYYYDGLWNGNVTSGNNYYRSMVWPTQLASTPTVTTTNGSNTRFPTTRTIDLVSNKCFREYRTADATGRGNFHSNVYAEVT